MRHGVLTAICLFLIHFIAFAEGDEPVIEIKADRTYIYPQRMELTGEESLMDILLMVPDLMVAGYEDVIASYNLRIDNCPVNGDNRLILRQMKAKDIAKIQVCDNTGVAKGTIGMGRVLDINMKTPDALSGFVEGQGGFGKELAGIATANALYGSRNTDLYANVSYRYQGGNEEYLTLHMTNRFGARDRLLTYFTQLYFGPAFRRFEQDHGPGEILPHLQRAGDGTARRGRISVFRRSGTLQHAAHVYRGAEYAFADRAAVHDVGC